VETCVFGLINNPHAAQIKIPLAQNTRRGGHPPIIDRFKPS
jgi:hypothetical protein